MEYGKQIGVIVYGSGINVRSYADEAVRAGYIVVYRDGHATIHERPTTTELRSNLAAAEHHRELRLTKTPITLDNEPAQ